MVYKTNITIEREFGYFQWCYINCTEYPYYNFIQKGTEKKNANVRSKKNMIMLLIEINEELLNNITSICIGSTGGVMQHYVIKFKLINKFFFDIDSHGITIEYLKYRTVIHREIIKIKDY